MNIKTIKELCSEAGLTCEAYRVPLSETKCLSISSPSSCTNIMCSLIEVMLDQPVLGTMSELEACNDELRALAIMLKNGRTAFKSRVEGRAHLIYWPHIAWEE